MGIPVNNLIKKCFDMKTLKKILKWTGLILLFLVTGITITVMMRQKTKYERPYPAITASSDTAVIAKGRHIIFGAGHCADCHSKANNDSLLKLGIDVPLTGGFEFKLPLGSIFTKNITPDMETGIGRFTDAELGRALRYGVHPDGTVVYPFMPFHNMTDEDLTAVISYLRAQKPVRNPVPNHDLTVMGKVIQAFFIKPVGPEGEVAASIKPDSTIEYGRYLATSVGNCNGCHTKRTNTGGWEGEQFAGGEMDEGGHMFYPPNLTPDPTTGHLNGWTQENFLQRFRMGRIQPGSPMPWPSYGRMSDLEIKAIFKYLKTLKPAKTSVVKKIN